MESAIMENKIQKQLEIIEKSNIWIKTSLEGNKARGAYRNMVNCRRKLNKKKMYWRAIQQRQYMEKVRSVSPI